MCRVWIALAVLAAQFVGCDAGTAPEDRVRAVIAAVEDAIEARSISQVAEHVENNYQDPHHRSQQAALRSLLGYFHRHRSIHLLTRIASVSLDENQQAASAVVFVAMAGVALESKETLVAVKADMYRFDFRLTNVDGNWKLSSAQWRGATISDFG